MEGQEGEEQTDQSDGRPGPTGGSSSGAVRGPAAGPARHSPAWQSSGTSAARQPGRPRLYQWYDGGPGPCHGDAARQSESLADGPPRHAAWHRVAAMDKILIHFSFFQIDESPTAGDSGRSD